MWAMIPCKFWVKPAQRIYLVVIHSKIAKEREREREENEKKNK